jgi:hypothetical protein
MAWLRFNRGVAGDLDQPDALHVAVAALGRNGDLAREHRTGGVLGVERVVFAVESAVGPVGTGDLDHTVTVAAQEPGQPDAVGAGALDPERHDTALCLGPGQQLLVALGRDIDAEVVQTAAKPVDSDRDVAVFVGVHADDDIGAGQWDAGHGCCPLVGGQRRSPWPGGRTGL